MYIKMEQKCFLNSAVKAIREGDLNKLISIVNTIPKEKVSEVVSSRDESGKTPLLIAVYRNNTSIVKFLLEECHLDLMATVECTRNSLFLAATRGEFEIVKMLIDSGVKLNAGNTKYHFSPLHAACFNNHQRVARFLIENGEDIDKSNCLMASIITTNAEFIKYLLESGANINISRDGDIPLIYCCQIGKLEMLKIFIEKGADQRGTFEGLTALQWAAIEGHEHIISFYLENNYCTQEEACDGFELLGVASILKADLPSAIKFWNKASDERPQAKPIVFESVILRGFQRNFNQLQNYDHLISDQENAVIHSLIILERVIRIENLRLNDYFGKLLNLMDLNIEFWEAILRSTIEHRISRIFFEADIHFTLLFGRYVRRCNEFFKDINSSILKLFYGFFNASSKIFSFKCDPLPSIPYQIYRSILIIGAMSLFSIKDNAPDFDMKLFHVYIKSIRNSVFLLDESRFQRLIENKYFWGFPDQVIYGTFELCCKLCEPINDLDWMNHTPLYFALASSQNDKFIDILLKYGAKTDIKNLKGESIRKRAELIGRHDICVGSPSLQILINGKLDLNKLAWKKQKSDLKRHDQENVELTVFCPPVLKHYINLH